MEGKTTKLLLLAILITTCAFGSTNADLANQIDSLIHQPSQKKVEFSVHVIKADTGETVYSYNADKPFVPASNVKIITSAAAVKYLGADFEYKTTVGLLSDTLVVIGSGDPLLGDKITDTKYSRKNNWIFEDIAAALKQQNVTAIKDIVIDSSIFDDQRVNPNWPMKELNRHYACEVSGLNYNGNCIEVTVENLEEKINISIEPKTDFVEVTNKVEPISEGKSAAGSYRQPKPNSIVVYGKCKKTEGPFAVAIENPAEFFACLLAERLAKEGIAVKESYTVRNVDDKKQIRVLKTYTTSIRDVLQRCNKDSFGLAAESLVKTIAAAEPAGQQGSWEKGREVIGKYLVELGISEEEFYIDDGSGLSEQNKLSASAITTVLADVYKSKSWPFYKDSLAVGGIDGTIGKYFKEEKYKGRIFGKTGYINSVKTFSGICSTENGDYIFSILTSNANDKTRPAINDIAKVIIDSGQRAANGG